MELPEVDLEGYVEWMRDTAKRVSFGGKEMSPEEYLKLGEKVLEEEDANVFKPLRKKLSKKAKKR